ncbi:N-acetyl-gamma-glutamyl-phosphate reductase [SAR202 cluster bacterium AD-804-J14_MRT_500m]|nr:N-acetyl-gamma-glutamyl-phosphate reductase [SAR202 cluster bacterium AD-804-J14_MRT_500m]
MTKIGIINVTGYAGAELARILYRHPEVEVTCVTGRSASGQQLSEVFPHLADINLPIVSDINESVDLVFSALPHKASAESVIPLLEKGLKIVDISADFRLNDVGQFEEWYKVKHPGAQYLDEAIYGLTELHRKQVSSARLVANPGCYPTSAILAMAPAIRAGIVGSDVVIDSKSGISGAGRGLNLATHFSEVNENLMAYSVRGHRHLPEIEQELSLLTNLPPQITFLTHLVPMTRGILSSCYAPLDEKSFSSITNVEATIVELYQEFYLDEPFVKVCTAPPQTKQTWGTNLCLIYPFVDIRTRKLIVISCLDNLVKGAAGQAVQNMNVMLGLTETIGLEPLAIYP